MYGLAGLSELNAATLASVFSARYMQLQSLSDRWFTGVAQLTQRHLEHFTGIVGSSRLPLYSGFHRSAQLVTDLDLPHHR